MTVRLFGCVCGQFHSPGAEMGMDGNRVTVPIPFYVIEHPDGVALFDCGLPAAMCDREEGYLKALQTQDLDVSLTPEETLTAHLERLDIDPASVRYAVISHLHFDHAGACANCRTRRWWFRRASGRRGSSANCPTAMACESAISTWVTPWRWSKASTICSVTAR